MTSVLPECVQTGNSFEIKLPKDVNSHKMCGQSKIAINIRSNLWGNLFFSLGKIISYLDNQL